MSEINVRPTEAMQSKFVLCIFLRILIFNFPSISFFVVVVFFRSRLLSHVDFLSIHFRILFATKKREKKKKQIGMFSGYTLWLSCEQMCIKAFVSQWIFICKLGDFGKDGRTTGRDGGNKSLIVFCVKMNKASKIWIYPFCQMAQNMQSLPCVVNSRFFHLMDFMIRFVWLWVFCML